MIINYRVGYIKGDVVGEVNRSGSYGIRKETICGDTLRGTISYCTNYMTIKTYGEAGQIVGFQSSYISILSCHGYGNIIYK